MEAQLCASGGSSSLDPSWPLLPVLQPQEGVSWSVRDSITSPSKLLGRQLRSEHPLLPRASLSLSLTPLPCSLPLPEGHTWNPSRCHNPTDPHGHTGPMIPTRPRLLSPFPCKSQVNLAVPVSEPGKLRPMWEETMGPSWLFLPLACIWRWSPSSGWGRALR